MAAYSCLTLGIVPAALFVGSRTLSSELLLEIWGRGGCVQLQVDVWPRRAINFRIYVIKLCSLVWASVLILGTVC